MPCPLCLLGYSEGEHSKELWASLGDPESENSKRLDVILQARRASIRKAEIESGLPLGSIVG